MLVPARSQAAGAVRAEEGMLACLSTRDDGFPLCKHALIPSPAPKIQGNESSMTHSKSTVPNKLQLAAPHLDTRKYGVKAPSRNAASTVRCQQPGIC